MRKLRDSKKSEKGGVIDEFGTTDKPLTDCCVNITEMQPGIENPEALKTFDCRDNIAASALQALLQLFAYKRSIFGAGLNEKEVVSRSYYIADEMYKQRTDNNYINEMAVRAMHGKLVGFWNNTRVFTVNGTRYSFTGFGIKDMPRFVQDCYRIAGMMSEEKLKTYEEYEIKGDRQNGTIT